MGLNNYFSLFRAALPAQKSQPAFETWPKSRYNPALLLCQEFTIKFKAILFDLDGTLLDTLEDLTDAFNDGLAEHGFATHSAADYAYFIGDGAYTTIQRALPAESRRDETVRKCLETMQRSYAARFDNKTRPYQQVPRMLQELHRKGYAMAVLSNKGDDFTKKIVARLLDETLFDVVQGLTSQAEKKPDPAMALQIAKKMKIEPEQFFYVGDTDTDMKTAVAAGMYPAGALWGFRTAKELLAHGAKVLLETPMDIIEVLEKTEDTQ